MNTIQKIVVIIATFLISVWLWVFFYMPINHTGPFPVIYYIMPILLLAVYIIGAWFFFSQFKN